VQVATAVGASVIGIDIGTDKLSRAVDLGAAATVDASQDNPVEAILELTSGGAHVSIDAVGRADTCRASVNSLRVRGRHLQLGHTTAVEQGHVALPIDVMLVKELEFLSAFGMAAQRFDTMMTMIEWGRLDPGAVVSSTVTLEQAGDVLRDMRTFDTAGVVVIDQF
jgi:D-arabinose 1-dehydrogenase-like Zn-dependent alcohol dehydrogenase